MAEQFVPIRSVKQYMKEYVYEGLIKKHADRNLIRQQLIDAFHKEIFGQFAAKFGEPELLAMDYSTIDAETRQKVDNIITNSVRKWKRLCIELAKYKETHGLIQPSDLMVTLEEIVQGQVGTPEAEDAHLVITENEESIGG